MHPNCSKKIKELKINYSNKLSKYKKILFKHLVLFHKKKITFFQSHFNTNRLKLPNYKHHQIEIIEMQV